MKWLGQHLLIKGMLQVSYLLSKLTLKFKNLFCWCNLSHIFSSRCRKAFPASHGAGRGVVSIALWNLWLRADGIFICTAEELLQGAAVLQSSAKQIVSFSFSDAQEDSQHLALIMIIVIISSQRAFNPNQMSPQTGTAITWTLFLFSLLYIPGDVTNSWLWADGCCLRSAIQHLCRAWAHSNAMRYQTITPSS